MSKQFVLMSQTNKQSWCYIDKHLCTWQRHSSVTTVNRALLPIWINVIIPVSKYTGLPIRTSLVQIWLGVFIYRFCWLHFFYFFLFCFFHLLCDLIFIRGCNFVTGIAKHSSQKFDINTMNIHKGIFSCNLWWFVDVCNIAVGVYWLATGRVWCAFSLLSFCLLVSDKFGQ